MMKWLRDWWYQDLPDEMQRKMLLEVHSNRPSLHNFVRRSAKRWRQSLIDQVLMQNEACRAHLMQNTAGGNYAGFQGGGGGHGTVGFITLGGNT